jgi:formyl-CoA transferase/CoA:oxalate CoA-transferase
VVPVTMGTSFPTIVPYRCYRASDREVAIAVGSEKLWSAFCEALGRPDLEKHPDYATNADRIRNRATLEPILDSVLAKRSGAEWIERLQKLGVPSSLVRNFGEVSTDPQNELRQMFPVMDHPMAGEHQVTGTAVKLSDTPGGPTTPAPLPGQHTRAALKELCVLDDREIDELVQRRVLFEADRTVESPS